MEEQGQPQSVEETPESHTGVSIGDPIEPYGDTIEGNGDHIKPNGEPIKGNGNPIEGNGDPIKPNGDPIKPNGDPIKPNGDPNKGNGDPFRPHGDPFKGNGNPINDTGTPIKPNETPIEGNGNPIEPYGDPIKVNETPINPNGDPIKTNGDPIIPNETPIDPHRAPIKPNGDPIKPNDTPIKPNGDPIKPNGDPVKPNDTPIKPNGDPFKPNETPIKPNGDPIKPNGDPFKPNDTPIKPNGDPIKPNDTPIIPNETPIKPYGDPIKPNGDPIKGNETPIKPNGPPIDPYREPIKPNDTLIKPNETPIKPNDTPIKPNVDPIKRNGDPIDPHVSPIDPNRAPLDPRVPPLRAQLEAALLQAPGLPLPPELTPLLALPLPPPHKCVLLDGAGLLRSNLRMPPGGGPPLGLPVVHRALTLLERYGRNLLQAPPPRHWRRVSRGNPAYRGALRHVTGAREVLMLLGYTSEEGEGLSFPPWVPAPHGPRVATVTADVLLLRRELELLMENQHPNPHFFTDILKGGEEEDLVTDAMPIVEHDGPIGDPPSRCDRPRTPPSSSTPPPAMGQPHSAMGQEEEGGGWACASCTFLNGSPSVLCGVCERPRLARRPPPQGWPCPHCTYFNHGPGPTCSLCHLHRSHPASPAPEGHVTAPDPHVTPSEPRPPAEPRPPPKATPPLDADQWRQRRLEQDGRRVVALLRAAELHGSAPPLPPPAPPHTLWVLAGAVGLYGAQEPGGPLGALSLPEALWGWGRAMGQAGGALRACMGRRRKQLKALSSMGFPDRLQSGLALFQSGGSISGALALLQAPLMGPFLQRLWDPHVPPMDWGCADQAPLIRRALAELPLPSWGRAQLLVGLGQELGYGAALGALLEAVGSCGDPEQLRRRLRCECAVCGAAVAREQAQVLPACQCWLCPECFRLHFRVGVRERRVRDLVCPSCARPDLRDPAAAAGYFCLLDAQLRQCLDPATYELFTQKLTELELERDPQFLWCPQCSFGFIFEAEQGPAQCPQCKHSCCPRCQRPWLPAHTSLSCAAFEAWLGSSNHQGAPEAPSLEAFLQEHSIGCPRCGARFALARGGCLHLQCSQCQHQFCSGCACPFHPRDSCPIDGCPLRGSLHGHHPRDCIFHLRDWSPTRLQRLLQDASIPYETELPAGFSPPPGGGCPVLEQKETPMGLKDEPCGRDTPLAHGGLCRGHYTEYLVHVINHHRLDPLPLYDSTELRACAERHLPGGRSQRRAGEGGVAYERRLRLLLQREAPLRGGATPPQDT